MRKKIAVLACFCGFLLGLPLLAANAQQAPICNYTPPISCFYANTIKTESTKWGRTAKEPSAPEHCPTPQNISIYKLADDPKNAELLHYNDLLTVCQQLNLLTTTECNVRNIQRGIKNSCGGTCYPLNEELTESGLDDGSQVVQCSEEFFIDGKYGICTKEAIRRYVEWVKVTSGVCNKAPDLIIHGEDIATKNKPWDTKITQEGGNVFIWDNEEKFISKEIVDDEIELENLKLKTDDCVDKDTAGWPKDMNIDEDDTVTYPKTREKCLLKADADVVVRDDLKSYGEKPLKIIAPVFDGVLTEKPKDPGKLSCETGLLPKYLVGASCQEELKGDARDITYWIQRFGKQITTFLAALAVLLIAWNAFGLVTAAGDSDQIATHKKALMWIGIGLAVAMFAYVIVKTAISLTFLQ